MNLFRFPNTQQQLTVKTRKNRNFPFYSSTNKNQLQSRFGQELLSIQLIPILLFPSLVRSIIMNIFSLKDGIFKLMLTFVICIFYLTLSLQLNTSLYSSVYVAGCFCYLNIFYLRMCISSDRSICLLQFCVFFSLRYIFCLHFYMYV